MSGFEMAEENLQIIILGLIVQADSQKTETGEYDISDWIFQSYLHLQCQAEA